MRQAIATMLGTALFLAGSTAMAQRRGDFGDRGTAAFSADRLFAFSTTHVTLENTPDDDEADHTSFGFAWRGQLSASPFDVPRLAFDYFIIDSLSLGGTIGYASVGGDEEGFPRTDVSSFIFYPRVGYVWMFSDVVGFWLRGGLTYHSVSVEDSYDESGLAFTVEPTFVFSPVDHFAFTAGINIDVDVTGGREYENGFEQDATYRSIGIQLGLMGWL